MSIELTLFHSSSLFKIKECSIAISHSGPKYLDATNMQIKWVECEFVGRRRKEHKIRVVGKWEEVWVRKQESRGVSRWLRRTDVPSRMKPSEPGGSSSGDSLKIYNPLKITFGTQSNRLSHFCPNTGFRISREFIESPN